MVKFFVKNKFDMGDFLVLIGIIIGVVFVGFYITTGGVQKPEVGDCIDVSEYDNSGITKYCRVLGNVQELTSGNRIIGYAFDLDTSSCDFECFDYVDENGNKVNLRRCPLPGANTIDGEIVSDSFCIGVGK